MARLTKSHGGALIDSGPITATSKLEDVPQEHWYSLMCHREMFVKARLPQDCRCLVQFVADAERMYEPLGFKDADDFIAHGLKLVPDEIRIAVNWLEINKPKEPIPKDIVLKLAKQGGDGSNQYIRKSKGSNATLAPIGRGCDYILARLERDGFSELLAKVQNGKLSVNAAAIKAGYRKKPKHHCPACGHEWRE
jgi:hypothetical protein